MLQKAVLHCKTLFALQKPPIHDASPPRGPRSSSRFPAGTCTQRGSRQRRTHVWRLVELLDLRHAPALGVLVAHIDLDEVAAVHLRYMWAVQAGQARTTL